MNSQPDTRQNQIEVSPRSNHQSQSHFSPFSNHNSSFRITLIPILILLVATFFRLYQLPVLPPGLNFDEAGNGVAAFDILRGSPRLWWQIGGGKEPLWPYLIALSTMLWGNIPLTLRLPAAFVGILTVAAVYPLMYAFFRHDGRRHARLISLLTMLGLALSGWHLHFSRLGFRAILLPLLSTLAFYFLWRTLVKSRLPDTAGVWPLLMLSALFTALAVYAYLAARLLPLVPVLYGVLYWLATKVRHLIQRQPTPATIQTNETRPLLILKFLLLTLLFLLPLVIYFLFNPGAFAARSTAVSIFNPAWNNGALIGTAWRTLAATLGTFFGIRGDANPLVNLPAQSALPWLLVVFFMIGLATSLYSAVRPWTSESARPAGTSPGLFLIAWWLVMVLPAILAPEGAPHHLRLIGAIVPTYALVAVGLAAAANILIRLLSTSFRSPQLASRMVLLLLAACFLVIALQTYTAYFIHWPASTDFTLPFDLYAIALADDIATAPPKTGYILPMDIRAGAETRHYTLDFLLGRLQPSPYAYLPVDERHAETILTQSAAGKEELRLVRWTADKHQEADEKEIVTFLLATNGYLADHQSFPVYDLDTFTLAPSPDFVLPTANRPLGTVFDGLLRLDTAYVPATAIPDQPLPVAVTLAPLAPMSVDYKASLRLISPDGELIAQKDRTLKHNFHQGTSLWPPEMVNEYYLLSVPADAPPGNFTVVIVIYQPDTLAPLVADGIVEVPLGNVRIE